MFDFDCTFLISRSKVLAFMLCLPLFVTFADDDKKPAPPETTAVIHGVFTNEEGAPLVGVKVRVVVPAIDMRFFKPSSNEREYETLSVRNGHYRIEIPNLTHATKASIDASRPGYRRLSEMFIFGGNVKVLDLKPDADVEASWVLKASRYIAGTVVDENDQAIAGVKIAGNANGKLFSTGVERTNSREDGKFELFNYPDKRLVMRGEETVGKLGFSHPDYLDAKIDDIYLIDSKEHRQLKVVMEAGFKVSGRILDQEGNPVPKMMVRIKAKDGKQRKAVLTDNKGQFQIKGLLPGENLLNVSAFDISEKENLVIDPSVNQEDLIVRLKKVELPKDLKTYDVLGMKLCDASMEVVELYEFLDIKIRGAMILDPGQNSDRLNVGKLRKGYAFFMVGQTRVTTVAEFVKQILQEADPQIPGNYVPDKFSIRVVYMLSTLEFDATNTQRLSLTQEDIDELKKLDAMLSAK